MQKNKNILSSLFFLITSFMFCTNILGVNLGEYKYGLNVYKKGNCMGCHFWHVKGVRGYGAGVSLRNSNLKLNEIVNVIKCGRPGTGMPYFLRKAYKEEKCYDTTFEDYDESYVIQSNGNDDPLQRIIYNQEMNYFTLFGPDGFFGVELNSSSPNELIDYR